MKKWKVTYTATVEVEVLAETEDEAYAVAVEDVTFIHKDTRDIRLQKVEELEKVTNLYNPHDR